MMVQMHVGRGEHLAAGLVLGLHQFLGEIRAVVVVDKGERAGHDFIFVGLFGNQVIAHKVAHRLRTILVTLSGNRAIESLQQIGVNRKTGPS